MAAPAFANPVPARVPRAAARGSAHHLAASLSAPRERAPRTPSDALRALILAGEAGALQEPAARRALAIVPTAEAPMALLFLSNIDRARAAGLDLRLILAQRRSWGWWRAGASAAALDLMGAERLRLLEGADAHRHYAQALFGMTAQWRGALLRQRGFFLGLGRVSPFSSDLEGAARALRAHARFETVWRSARPI